MSKVNLTLFKNANKASSKQPDFSSSQKDANGDWINMVAGWIRRDDNGAPKQDKNGNIYISLSIDTDELDRYIQFQESKKEEAGKASDDEMAKVFA